MLIFGTRVILSKIVSSGKFYCPNCKSDQHQNTRVYRKFFHIFFIPIIPLDIIDHVVICDRCQTHWKTDVLDIPTDESDTAVKLSSMHAMIAAAMSVDNTNKNKQQIAIIAFRAFEDSVTSGSSQIATSELEYDLILPVSDAYTALKLASSRLSTPMKEILVKIGTRVAVSAGDQSPLSLRRVVDAGTILGLSEAHIKGVLLDEIG